MPWLYLSRFGLRAVGVGVPRRAREGDVNEWRMEAVRARLWMDGLFVQWIGAGSDRGFVCLGVRSLGPSLFRKRYWALGLIYG
jgi:hypothetical protein